MEEDEELKALIAAWAKGSCEACPEKIVLAIRAMIKKSLAGETDTPVEE